MSVCNVVLAKEFKGYFRNGSAFVLLAVYLGLSLFSTYYSASFFVYDNYNLMSFFMYQPEVLNMLLPALTMKMWAEEKKSGTMEFLLTQPVSYTVLVLGKFAAAFCFGVLLLAMTLPFAVGCAFFMPLDVLNILSGYLAVILVIGVLCALGCVVSVFNENAILAYIISVFIGWLLLLLGGDALLTPLNGLSPRLLSMVYGALNFMDNYRELTAGQVTLSGIVYFVLPGVFLLWFNIIVLEYRKR